MPVMERQPLQEHNNEKEEKAQNSRGKHPHDRVGDLHLIVCINDCIVRHLTVACLLVISSNCLPIAPPTMHL
jgi:hypothetical protein